jgi:hypothetical protein
MGFLWQAVAFADHVALGALTLEFATEIERLRAQHTDVVREKSAAENKSRRLTERLAAAEAEKGDLRRQLAEERRDANKAYADAQAAQAEAKLARAEASLAVGAKAKTPPFARCLHRPRWINEDKTTDRLTLRPTRRWTKTYNEVISSCDLVLHGGPHGRPIVTGPAWPLRVTGLFCKSLPVITVYNPALWEYSGDNLGAWGHMRP